MWLRVYQEKASKADDKSKDLLSMLALREAELLTRSEEALDAIEAEMRSAGITPPERLGDGARER